MEFNTRPELAGAARHGRTLERSPEARAGEGRAPADALVHPPLASRLLVAEHERLGLAGVLLLEARRDYFTDEPHGHVAILAVAREAEGQGWAEPDAKASGV